MKSHLLTGALIAAIAASGATASTEKLLYSFPANSNPLGPPDQDIKGAIYGTAETLDENGAIYRINARKGEWREKTLFNFSGSNGEAPSAGPLIDRATKIIYGTTIAGGTGGYGTVYSLAPAGHGWTENVLHSFLLADGSPYAMLLKDKATGSLYGTTNSGGLYNCGTAFQLAKSNETWSFSTIYTFQGNGDACKPFTQLTPGARAGTLIGATSDGYGQIFQLKKKNGVWTDSIIYSFTQGIGGAFPSDLAAASDGTIYGVAGSSGQYGQGVVFKLTPTSNKYSYSVIYDFRGGSDGANGSGINVDGATGRLYGTTSYGGTADEGTVFRLTPNGNAWTETVLHSFTGGANDGANPASRPIVDPTTGALYGTTQFGGSKNGGTVYMVQP